MRIIIAGSRGVSREQVVDAIERCPWIGFASTIISGTAKGADSFGEEWAQANGVKIEYFAANWAKYKRAAGPKRNADMADHSQGLIAVWDGKSRGTKNMIEEASKRGLRILLANTETRKIESTDAKGALANLWDTVEERAAVIEFGSSTTRREAERATGVWGLEEAAGLEHPKSEPRSNPSGSPLKE